MTKRTYHHTAIFGSSFCKSSHESFYLKLRNENLLEEAGPVSLLSIFYPKFLITSGVTLGSYVLLDFFYGEELFSIVSVAAFIAVFVWYITEMFTDVLGEAVSTLLYCYIADDEIMGTEGAQFAFPELDEFLDGIYGSSTSLIIGGASHTEDERFEAKRIPNHVEFS